MHWENRPIRSPYKHLNETHKEFVGEDVQETPTGELGKVNESWNDAKKQLRNTLRDEMRCPMLHKELKEEEKGTVIAAHLKSI